MLDRSRAPVEQRELPVGERRGEASVGASGRDTPVGEARVMERVVARENLLAARRRGKRNGGSPGSDGMTGEAWPGYRREHWPQIREARLAGTAPTAAGDAGEIPQPGGGVRKLGIPTVLDRRIQQAGRQALQPEWAKTFSERSDGCRPGRSAHQAVAQAQRYLGEGDGWVVDLEQFFDRVNHDKLMSRVKLRVADRRVLRRIDRDLKAGQHEVRQLTARTRGVSRRRVVGDLRQDLDGLSATLASRKHRRESRSWTPGSGGGCATICGSRGVGGGTGSCGAVG
jgi:RNA-directed DNA polymerase